MRSGAGPFGSTFEVVTWPTLDVLDPEAALLLFFFGSSTDSLVRLLGIGFPLFFASC